MPMPLRNGYFIPPPCTLVNSIGFIYALGYPIFTWASNRPSPYAILDSVPIPGGAYTFQGIIFNGSSSAFYGLSLTNATR